MTVMFNGMLAEQIPNVVLPNISSKTGTNSNKSVKGFANALAVETDKSGMDVDSKGKSDDSVQLMAAMVGMVLPVIGNLVGVANNTQVKLPEIMPGGVSQANVAQIVSDGVSQANVAQIVSSGVSQANVAQIVPSGVSQANVAQIVPSGVSQANNVAQIMPSGVSQANVAQIMTSGVSQANVAQTVPGGVSQANVAQTVPSGVSQANVAQIMPGDIAKVGLTSDINTDQNQFATKTAPSSQVDSNQLGNFPQMQPQLQNTQNVEQAQATDLSKKSSDVLTDNPVSIITLPSFASIGNSNSFGKNSSKQIDDKKIVVGPVNSEAADVANSAVDVKSMLAPQATVNIVDDLAGGGKENSSTLLGTKEQLNADTILSDHTVKNNDVFASMLNQQGINIGNQSGMPEVKQVSPQPMSDSYNIASQIVDQARLVTKPQNTEMIIQLKPEHLGELTFKVTVENGIVSASFHSNNAEVRSTIESSLTQLKQELSNQGLKIDNVGVYAGLGQFFSNGQQSGGNQQPVPKVPNKKKTEDFLDVFEANDSANKVLDVSGVDYRA